MINGRTHLLMLCVALIGLWYIFVSEIVQLVVKGLVMWDRLKNGSLNLTISVLNIFYNKETIPLWGFHN